MKRSPYLYFALIGLCFLVYANSLNNSFLPIDDIPAIIKNPWISHPLNFWGAPPELLNSLIYLIAKSNVVPYHLISIILHSLVTVLVFQFLCLLFKTEPSFLAAALFAVHPIHAEPVAWISGKPYIILGLFIFLTYLLYYRATQDDNVDKKSQRLNYAVSLGLFSYFIINSYSFYSLFPFLIILSDITFNRWKKNWKLWIPFLFIAILRVILAKEVLQGRINLVSGYTVGKAHACINLIIPLVYSIFSHLWLLFWPARLTFFHEPMVFYPWVVGVGFIALVIFACFLPRIFKKEKRVFLGIGIYALFLAPTFSPIPLTFIVAESHAYVSSIFFSILAAFCYERYSKTLVGKKRAWFLALFIFLIVAYGVRTLFRNRDLKDNLRFSRAALKVSYSNPQAHNNMGAIYLQEGNMVKAMEEFNIAMKLKPDFAQTYNNRGAAYQAQGNLGQAILDFTRAIEINPRYSEPRYNRGLCLQSQGKLKEALADYTEAIRLSPNFAEAYVNRGVIYRRQGKLDQAILDYTKVIQLNPNYAEVYNNRGFVYQEQGNLSGAILDYTRTIEINPNYAQALQNRAIAYFHQKEYLKSWQDVHKAEALGYEVNSDFLEDLKKASRREK